jgi:hypothetical protein
MHARSALLVIGAAIALLADGGVAYAAVSGGPVDTPAASSTGYVAEQAVGCDLARAFLSDGRENLPLARRQHEARSAANRDPSRDQDHRVALFSVSCRSWIAAVLAGGEKFISVAFPEARLIALEGCCIFRFASSSEKSRGYRACSRPTRLELWRGGA